MIAKHYVTRICGLFFILLTSTVISPSMSLAAGDVFDQFYRYVEVKNKTFEPHLPGEKVDHFAWTLRIVKEDMSFPGHAGLDLRIIRTYSCTIWERSDLLGTTSSRFLLTMSQALSDLAGQCTWAECVVFYL